MPFRKLQFNPKSDKGARGTKQASEMLELMVENWDQLQEKFADYSESEKEEMIDHFNNTIENLGDMLFGDDANVDDFEQLVSSFEETEQGKFMESVQEALLIEYD